ncbi:MAG: hypothetical protein ABIH49_02800 [archaeon]
MKKGLEMSFAWLFAIITGVIILLIAIYASTRVIQTEQTAVDAQTAKEIGVILNPLETGFETGKTTSIALPTETRIYNRCNNENYFGEQIIKISQRSFNKWTDTNIDVSFRNKYIFSDNYTEGEKFFVFSKPFEFPFKVSDVIYLTSSQKKYCFKGFGEEEQDIREELSNLNQENIAIEQCPADAVEVCFNDESCEIYVNWNSRYVEKNNEIMDFDDTALMYAAVFSDKETYDCHVERLMQRTEQLLNIYIEKENFVAREGCNSNLGADLALLKDGVSAESFNIVTLSNRADEIKDSNDVASCKLW